MPHAYECASTKPGNSSVRDMCLPVDTNFIKHLHRMSSTSIRNHPDKVTSSLHR